MNTRIVACLALLVAVASAAECPTCGFLGASFTNRGPPGNDEMGAQLKEKYANNTLAEYIMGMDICPSEPVTCQNGSFCMSMNMRREMNNDNNGWGIGQQQVVMGCLLDIIADLNETLPDIGNISEMEEDEVCRRMMEEACNDEEEEEEEEILDWLLGREPCNNGNGNGNGFGRCRGNNGNKQKRRCHFKCGNWELVDSVIDRPYNAYIVRLIFNGLPLISTTTAASTPAPSTEAPTSTSAVDRARRAMDIPAAAKTQLEDELAEEYENIDGFLRVEITEATDNGDGTYEVQFNIYFSSLITPDEEVVRSAVDTFILSNSYAEDGQTPTYSFEAAKESDAGRVLASAFVLLAGLLALSA